MTYNEYLLLLKSFSYKKGTRIAIHSANSADYVYIVRACWELELTPVNININLPLDKVLYILKVTESQLIFSIFNNNIYNIETLIIKTSRNQKVFIPIFTGNLENEGSIIFTSGSTGIPKGVLHTVGNHYYSALGSKENIDFKMNDCWLASLPFYHISGFSLIMRATIAGGNIMISDKITSDITHISLVPSQLIKYLEDENNIKILKNLKALLLGGDAIPKKLIDKAIEYDFPVFTTYGSSESASQLTTTSSKRLKNERYTSGHLLNYRKLKITNDGKIFIKGKVLFKKYINDTVPINRDGWFDTGDLGFLDKHNNLVVKGRANTSFISGGINIYPKEIEKIISQLDFIESCKIVPKNHNIYGQVPIAYININKEIADFADIIKDYLSDKLEKYKIPKEIYLQSSLKEIKKV